MITRKRALIPTNRPMMFESPNSSERTRVFLVMISHDLLPPIFHENTPLQRMRTIRVEPGESPRIEPSPPATGPLPEMVLAVHPMPGTLGRTPLNSRLVQGEIMRDQLGRLYEKTGLQLSPLHCLVSGPGGEILELAPRAQQPWDVQGTAVQHDPDLDANEGARNATVKTGAPACRKLLPDPGEWRIVCLGDFKDMLAAQLSHAERLRDSHRLACYVQVYEITKTQRIESLAREVFGKPDTDRQLCPLTPALATRLQLMPLLQRRPHIPLQMRREQGLLLPNDRLFSLQLINDPTADQTTLAQNQSQTDSPPVATSGEGLALASCPRKSVIPERFLKPWEFQLSREEALYDVKLDGSFNRLMQRAKAWLQGRKQFQKWQALLSGKNLEEQLWSVRPPKGAMSYPSVQEWARKTLEKAGYDSATMLIEWQVYWRRKGLS
jgi:hypothetical protein